MTGDVPESALGARLAEWDDAAWCLAAVALAVRESSPLGAAAKDVLTAVGIGEPPADDPTTAARVGSQAGSALHLTSALLRGEDLGWAANDDDGLRAQGHASAQGPAIFARFMVPRMGNLGELLAAPGARMLDVGTGIAALAVAYAETFPALEVLGLDVFDRALELAQETIAASPAGARVSVRKQDVADLAESDAFVLGWLPAPFIPPAAVQAGLPRMVAALRRDGWLIVGHGKYGDDPVRDALTRLKTTAFGGTALSSDECQQLLRAQGLVDVQTFPTPPGAPGITVGRRAE